MLSGSREEKECHAIDHGSKIATIHSLKHEKNPSPISDGLVVGERLANVFGFDVAMCVLVLGSVERVLLLLGTLRELRMRRGVRAGVGGVCD